MIVIVIVVVVAFARDVSSLLYIETSKVNVPVAVGVPVIEPSLPIVSPAGRVEPSARMIIASWSVSIAPEYGTLR